jgi:hypothetical protein
VGCVLTQAAQARARGIDSAMSGCATHLGAAVSTRWADANPFQRIIVDCLFFDLLCAAPPHTCHIRWRWACLSGELIKHLVNATNPRLLGYNVEGLCFLERLSVVSFRLLTCRRRALLRCRASFCLGCTSCNTLAIDFKSNPIHNCAITCGSIWLRECACSTTATSVETADPSAPVCRPGDIMAGL